MNTKASNDLQLRLVTFAQAQKLKELGFPQYGCCDEYYNQEGRLVDKFCNLNKLIYPAPTYIKVWLWMWREKRIPIDIDCYNGFWSSDVIGTDCNDPEEAIIIAVEHLVDNNLNLTE